MIKVWVDLYNYNCLVKVQEKWQSLYTMEIWNMLADHINK